MLRKKGFIGVSIFTVMFVVAWWGNGINERYYHVDPEAGEGEFQLLGVDPDERFIRLEPFKPREYIRVQNRQGLVPVE
ncbi:hypothetical protein ACJ2A9_05890 [Anaerobacillus sp. MEB173]|uniref:hypothetical protein n=1 Tax=Anaerobacillus sp. MEB173 TaxID=3383345 RepID=UPI003F90E008